MSMDSIKFSLISFFQGASPVFKAMLTHPTEEAQSGRILVTDVNAEVLEQVLKFIYRDHIGPEVVGLLAEEVCHAADKYGLDKLVRHCENRLLASVTVENALIMYDLAARRPHSSSLLKEKSLQIISK